MPAHRQCKRQGRRRGGWDGSMLHIDRLTLRRAEGRAEAQLSVSLQLCSRLRCRVSGTHAAAERGSGLSPSCSMLRARAAGSGERVARRWRRLQSCTRWPAAASWRRANLEVEGVGRKRRSGVWWGPRQQARARKALARAASPGQDGARQNPRRRASPLPLQTAPHERHAVVAGAVGSACERWALRAPSALAPASSRRAPCCRQPATHITCCGLSTGEGAPPGVGERRHRYRRAPWALLAVFSKLE